MIRDLYEVKDKIIKSEATNNNDLYKSHLYWSQKPFNICDILIESFSEDGDVILDPFMGSGVTIIQALNKKIKRRAVGVEINDVPVFIVKTLLSSYNYKQISEVILRFVDKIKRLNSYYETKCQACGETGIIQKVIFDRADWKSQPELKTICYKCTCNKKVLTKQADEEDIKKINIKYDVKNIEDIVLINNSRLAVYEGQKISSIFTKRNFAVLDNIIGHMNDENKEILPCLKYIILSILHLSKITDTHSNSQWPLWTPKKDCVEKNIPELFEKRANLFLKSIRFAETNLYRGRHEVDTFKQLGNGDYLIFQKGVQNLEDIDIPDNSVDLIITDPPYLGQVLYSEYMQLYTPFLKLAFNLEDEIVVSTSPQRDKKEENYYSLMEQAFIKISAKLKNGKYMCMYFHDSNLDVWYNLISILERVGLRYLSQVHVKKKNTLKNIISPKKSLNGDAVLFFVKEPIKKNSTIEIESTEEMELNIVRHAKFIIKQKGPLSTPELYDDGMMEFIIHNGWLHKLSLEYKSLVDIFEKHLIWDQEIGKWKC
ncbi:DNA methyltransferase [Clostridium butyricum]|uniref:DNA methyltransferase n=1 Tax=Clostridium butyricum TaxID=1492 RepID=UPI0018914C80|nr:DNA methyltransferase [Clostridium butyricum]